MKEEISRKNWRLTLAYDGAEFHGWQIQPDASATPTVQAALAAAISAVTGEQVLPQGAGRTDAGVHALGQVANFPLQSPIPAENLLRALNRVLPAAILVHSATAAPPGFHARHSACGKVYRYCIVQSPKCPPHLSRYAVAVRWPLDVGAMQAAAQQVVGRHDFTSFAATDPDQSERRGKDAGSMVREIYSSDWEETQTDGGLLAGAQNLLVYTVQGNGFLHHMVRNLVGTFLDVGRGAVSPEAVPGILAARDRCSAGPTAPPNGLYLVKVLYPEPVG
jgi:tRNA pseudouridine38-40 synthase